MSHRLLWKHKKVRKDMDHFTRKMISGEYTPNEDFGDDFLYGLTMMDVCTPMESIPESEEEEFNPQIKSFIEELKNYNIEETVETDSSCDTKYSPTLATIFEVELEDDVFEDSSNDMKREIEESESREDADTAKPVSDSVMGGNGDLAKMEATRLHAQLKYTKYLTEKEKRQLESVFCGLKTKVYVCSCPVTLYFCGPVFRFESKNQIWMKQFYGVPVVVLEKDGPTKKLWLCIAERGTGFPLWRERLTFQSAYLRETSVFHVLSFSKNLLMKVGLSFECEFSATGLWAHISRLASRLENIAVSLPRCGRGCNFRKRRRRNRIDKLEISSPCCFQHITSVRPSDLQRFHSLQLCLSDNQNIV